MTLYNEFIVDATGCTPGDAIIVEDLMRNEIFHSTLDWQTREQLRNAAREAFGIFNSDRKFFEEHYRSTRAAFREMKTECEA